MKKCISHHNACDCREANFLGLERKLAKAIEVLTDFSTCTDLNGTLIGESVKQVAQEALDAINEGEG